MPAASDTTPYVLVHGFADDAATWRPLLAHLHGGPAHAWDLPGHGARSDESGPLHRDAAVGEMQDRIGELAYPVRLVGHSLGGYLALMAALTRPELVASLTLISSGPGFRKPAARKSWNDYIDSIAAKTGMPAGVTGLAHQPDSYVIDHIGELRCPLVHVLGSRDTRYRAGAEFLRAVLPTSALVEIEGAGHHPQRSHPEHVAAAIAGLRRR